MPRRIALIVGVSQYEPHTKLGNLSAPVNDAQRVYDVLSEYGGFDMLYPLPLGTNKVGISGKVKGDTLREELRKILNPQASEEVELAVFYFSGHGVSHHSMASYLSATDEQLAVPLSFLIELAENSAVKNLCIWLDCCHSGEVLKFKPSEKKSFCLVAASTADGEALAKNGQSLLTEILCEALTPNQDRPEIRVMEFVDYLEAHRKNLPQQVLFRGNSAFTLTQYHGEVSVASPYPPKHPPYKGLLTFTQADREFFFGRDGMIQQLLDKLSASRFMPLLGASGSGKSSLVLAGLLPKLPESDWQVLVMRPTAQPLQNLRDTLVRGFPDAQVGTLASGADLQREVLRLVTAGKRLLLVIDQFEEVFTECRDDAARAAFFACLLEALDSDNPLHLVLTLRADFLGHCTEQAYSGLGQRLQHHALLLVAPTAGELREAITRPLALVGMRCEQALEDELVDQTLHAKSSLPLLQYVLEKLWQSARQERSRELTLAMYQQLGGQHGGGLRGVLNEKADAFYQQLEPQQQRLMEWLMVELTQVGDGQDDTRRTVTLQELHNRQPQYTAALDALLAQLVTHERLLTQDHDDDGQATITVAHEALIRDWQRLRDWLESSREIKSWRSRMEDSISAWKNKVSGSLLREKRLAEAQQIIDRNPNSLLIGQDERTFIVASQTEEKHRKRAKTQLVVLIMALLFIGILVTTWQWRVAEQQRQEANRQAKVALASKLSGQAELAIQQPSPSNGWVDHALLLAVQAFRFAPSNRSTLAGLRDSLQEVGRMRHILYTTSSIWALASSPNGRHVVSAGNDNTLYLWDVTTGKPIGEPWRGHEASIDAIAFSPDGRYVLSAGNDMYLWDVTTGKPIGEPWRGHEASIDAIAFSPDGRYVLSAGNDKTLRLWDVANGQQVGKPWLTYSSTKGVNDIAFSPDGHRVVSANNNNTLTLWDVVTGQPVGTPWQGHTKPVTAVAFSPDGKYVVSGSYDNTLRLWDAISGQTISEPWIGHESFVTKVAFSPDSKYVVSSSYDGRLHLWSLNYFSGKPIEQYQMRHGIQEEQLVDVTFSSDGKYVISGSSWDKTLRLWDVANEQILAQPSRGEFWGISDANFSSDGHYMVSINHDNTLQLWDVVTGQLVGTLWQGDKNAVLAVAFSLDGKYVISANGNNTLTLWDVANGQQVGESWQGHEDAASAVAFSSDGKYVVSGSWDKTLRLWDVANGQQVGEPWQGHEGWISAVAFSSDNRYVLSGSQDKTLRLWDVKTGHPIGKPWLGHEREVSVVAFSPNNKYAVSGGWDHQLCKWDVTTGKLIGVPWQGHEDSIEAITFTADGRYMISGSKDNALYQWDMDSGQSVGRSWQRTNNFIGIKAINVDPNSKYVTIVNENNILYSWDADPESWAKKACSIVNRNFSLAEWQRFIGDALPYEKTCPDLPAPGEKGWVEPYAG